MLCGMEPIGRAPQSSRGCGVHPLGAGLIPAHAQQRISLAAQGMTPFSPEQPAPCVGAHVPGDQSSSATSHSEAMQSPSLEISKPN